MEKNFFIIILPTCKTSFFTCMIRSMKKLRFLFLTLFCFISLFACNQKEQDIVAAQEIEIDIEPTSKNIQSTIPLWIPGDYPKVVIVFGHGYETEEQQKQVLSVLEENFGLAKNDGLIVPLTFPETYFSNKRVRNAWLREALVGQDICAIITLAAPERTHYSLADLQDYGFPAKVYSVFPQDDELGTESGSEFVLNYKSLGARIDESPVYVIDQSKTNSNSSVKNFEEESVFKGDITKVLIPIIKRVKTVNTRAIPETPASFASYLQKSYSEIFLDSTLNPFVDAQTGIKSLNHYVLGVYDE